MSERKVGESFVKLFNKAEGKRIIIATFASNVHRVQQIINNAVDTWQKSGCVRQKYGECYLKGHRAWLS